MPTLDRSVVADLPLFAGLASGDIDEILREAHSLRRGEIEPHLAGRIFAS